MRESEIRSTKISLEEEVWEIHVCVCVCVCEIEMAPIFLVFWLELIVTFKHKRWEDRLCSDHYAQPTHMSEIWEVGKICILHA